MGHFVAALNRVRRIENGVSAAESDYLCARLMKQYLSGAAKMCRQEAIEVSSPFFNAANLVGASFAEGTSGLEAESLSHIEGVYRRISCFNYLVWCAALDQHVALAMRHPHVFEPLMELVEQGGSITLHHGELILSAAAFPLRNWLQQY
jgi:hypothetical protein